MIALGPNFTDTPRKDLGQDTYRYLHSLAQAHAEKLYADCAEFGSDFSSAEQTAIESAIYYALIQAAS